MARILLDGAMRLTMWNHWGITIYLTFANFRAKLKA